MRSLAYSIVTTALCALPGVASAQLDVSQCAAALQQDYESSLYTRTEQLHYIRTVDEKTWTTLAKAGGASASLFGLITLGASWADFSEQRKQLFDQMNYDYSITEAQTLIRIVTRDRAYDAYEACLNKLGDVEGVSPIRVSPTKITRDRIELTVSFRNPSNVRSEALGIQITNGAISQLPSGMSDWKGWHTFGVNQSVGLTIQRTAGSDYTRIKVSSKAGRPPVEVEFPRADGLLTVEVPSTPVAVAYREDYQLTQEAHDVNCTSGCWRCVGNRCVLRNAFTYHASIPGHVLGTATITCPGVSPKFEADLSAQLSGLSESIRESLKAKAREEMRARCVFFGFARSLTENRETLEVDFGNWSHSAYAKIQYAELAPTSATSSEEPLVCGRTIRITVVNEAIGQTALLLKNTVTGDSAVALGTSGSGLTLQTGPIPVGPKTHYVYQYKTAGCVEAR